MADQAHKNWTFWRSHIFRQGETLAKLHGNALLPVPLKRIAESRNVRRVVFRPLLVDGCLTITDEGFNIYVRCEKERAQEATTKFEAEDQTAGLPTRMRFTIAHEIAHTFFFDLSRGRPRNRLAVDHHNSVRTLERVCNQAAARMLLPTDLVRLEFKKLDVYDPAALRRLAEKAVVSPQMLVNRMGELLSHLNGIGGFGYAEPDGLGYRLKAIRTHCLLEDVFPRATIGSLVSDLIASPKFLLNGGPVSDETVELTCRSKLSTFTQRFRFVCENQNYGGRRSKGVFLTFQRLE